MPTSLMVSVGLILPAAGNIELARVWAESKGSKLDPNSWTEVFPTSNPVSEVVGRLIDISILARNIGESGGFLTVTFIDNDTGQILYSERSSFPIPAGTSYLVYLGNTTMPDRNFNIRIDVSVS